MRDLPLARLQITALVAVTSPAATPCVTRSGCAHATAQSVQPTTNGSVSVYRTRSVFIRCPPKVVAALEAFQANGASAAYWRTSAFAQKRSFDHPVGAAQHRVGNSNAERLGSTLIDDQLGLGRPFDRDAGRLCALQDPVGYSRTAPLRIGDFRAVRHQSANLGPLRAMPDEREPVAQRGLDDLAAARDKRVRRRKSHRDNSRSP